MLRMRFWANLTFLGLKNMTGLFSLSASLERRNENFILYDRKRRVEY